MNSDDNNVTNDTLVMPDNLKLDQEPGGFPSESQGETTEVRPDIEKDAISATDQLNSNQVEIEPTNQLSQETSLGQPSPAQPTDQIEPPVSDGNVPIQSTPSGFAPASVISHTSAVLGSPENSQAAPSPAKTIDPAAKEARKAKLKSILKWFIVVFNFTLAGFLLYYYLYMSK
jgi:hypothetical protein